MGFNHILFLGKIVYLTTPGGVFTGVLFLSYTTISCPIFHEFLKDICKIPKKDVFIVAVLVLSFIAAVVSLRTKILAAHPQ